jgi:hypothetical protein
VRRFNEFSFITPVAQSDIEGSESATSKPHPSRGSRVESSLTTYKMNTTKDAGGRKDASREEKDA